VPLLPKSVASVRATTPAPVPGAYLAVDCLLRLQLISLSRMVRIPADDFGGSLLVFLGRAVFNARASVPPL